MKGYVQNKVVGKDRLGTDGIILRRAIYKPDNLPEGISADELFKEGYVSILCKCDDEQIEFLADVVSRKLLVINGIPFYCSSGTSDDYSVISPAWRKNIWMPFMGYEVTGRQPGRIAKLGDNISEEFAVFAERIVQDWAANISNDELRLLWKPQNREIFERRATLEDLSSQIMRFGALEAFALSMQLLPETVWTCDETTGENFTALRSLRDYYLSHYEKTYPKISENLILEVKNASFEPINEDFHIVESTSSGQYQLIDRRAITDSREKQNIRRENAEQAYNINRKINALGVNIKHVAQLNNPETQIPNTLAANIGALIIRLGDCSVEDAKESWDKGINEIIDNLLSLEEEIDTEHQKKQYKIIFEEVLKISQELKKCNKVAEISFILKKLDSIEVLQHIGIESIQEEILNQIYYKYLNQLKKLTQDCMQYTNKDNNTYTVLRKLNELLAEKSQSPQKSTELFFQYLLENDEVNLKTLKNDSSMNVKKFIQGVSIIAAIIVTGIIPGLAISIAIYLTTNHSVFDFFKPDRKGKEFADQLEEMQNNLATVIG